MLDRTQQCLFIHIPKTAGQSVESVFLTHAGLDWKQRELLLLKPNSDPTKGPPRLAHLTAREYLDCGYIASTKFDHLFKFSFVRNPWSRLVSEYLYQHRHKNFKTFVMDELPNIGTDDYINHKGYHRHIMPQWQFIYDNSNKLMVDFVGKYESLQTDFDVIRSKLQLPQHVLPHKNKTLGVRNLFFKTKKKSYLSYFDNETYDFVSQFYQKDIELFGYDKNLDSN